MCVCVRVRSRACVWSTGLSSICDFGSDKIWKSDFRCVISLDEMAVDVTELPEI